LLSSKFPEIWACNNCTENKSYLDHGRHHIIFQMTALTETLAK